MPWQFVTAIIIFAVAGFLFAAFLNTRGKYKAAVALAQSAKSDRYDSYENDKKVKEAKINVDGMRGLVILSVMLGLLLTFFASANTVPVRNVGIVTSFNRPTGDTTGSGLHFVAPWEDIDQFDASVQTTKHVGDWNQGCSVVRIGSMATACVENIIQWQVDPAAAPRLFNDYKGSFENFDHNYVQTQIQNSLNAVFATYNPLSQVNLQTGQTGFDGAKLQEQVKQTLVQSMGDSVKIITVSIPLVHHDAQTEANIKQFQDVVAQSRILDQKSQNADKEKLVSDKLKAVLSDEYLKNKCIEESVKLGYAPGLCLMDSGIVTAPTTKAAK